MQGKQSWKSAAGRTLNVAGTFTRGSAVVDFTSFTATATLGTLANESSGILGPWATTGSTTTLNYVKSTAGVIAAYTGQTAGTAGTLANVTNPVSNYSFAAAATLTGPVTANTLRYTGAAATVANAGFTTTLNGLMHAGTGALTMSGAGNLVIGAKKELVIITNTQATTISSPIVNNSGGASALTYSGSGALTLSAVNTYSGGTTVNAGIIALGNAAVAALGTGPVTVNTGATLTLNRNTLTNSLTLNGGSLVGTNGFGEAWSAPITLAATSTVNSGYNMAWTGPVSGPGGHHQDRCRSADPAMARTPTSAAPRSILEASMPGSTSWTPPQSPRSGRDR